MQRQRQVADRVREIKTDDDPMLLRRHRDFLDVE